MIPAFGSPRTPPTSPPPYSTTDSYSRARSRRCWMIRASTSWDPDGVDFGARRRGQLEMIAAAAAKTSKPVTSHGRAGTASPRRRRSLQRRSAVHHHARAACSGLRHAVALCGDRGGCCRATCRRYHAERPELPAGAVTLNETESKAVLAAFGVPVAREVLVPPGVDVAAAAAGLRGPFAVKIVSRDIAHKTEAGGVKLGVAREGLARRRSRSSRTPQGQGRARRSTACWWARWRAGWRC